MPNERIRGRYPSKVRELRERALLTRVEFWHRSVRLAESNPDEFRAVTTETLRNLEGGFTKPRPSTARTVSAVLGAPATEIFPNGIDSGRRHFEK